MYSAIVKQYKKLHMPVIKAYSITYGQSKYSCECTCGWYLTTKDTMPPTWQNPGDDKKQDFFFSKANADSGYTLYHSSKLEPE
jgi:hypothetical protein